MARVSPPVSPAIGRWQQWGLAGNPFRRLSDAELAAAYLPEEGFPATADQAQEWLPDRPGFVQVIGGDGVGKSAALAALRAYAEQLGWQPDHHLVCEGVRTLWPNEDRPIGVCLVDEIDRLSRDCLWTWLHRCAADGGLLIVGVHRDLAAKARACGLRTRTLLLQPADADWLRQWFHTRLARARITAEHRIDVIDEVFTVIAQQTRGSRAAAEAIFYNLFQHLVEHRTPASTTLDLHFVYEACQSRAAAL